MRHTLKVSGVQGPAARHSRAHEGWQRPGQRARWQGSPAARGTRAMGEQSCSQRKGPGAVAGLSCSCSLPPVTGRGTATHRGGTLQDGQTLQGEPEASLGEAHHIVLRDPQDMGRGGGKGKALGIALQVGAHMDWVLWRTEFAQVLRT